MVDILHKVGIRLSSPDEVYRALTSIARLARWWTVDARGRSDVIGGIIEIRFPGGGFDMSVVALDPGRRVLWRVIEGPEEWIGTRISFDIGQEEDWTILRFKHLDWKEPVDFMHHCSTKWAIFLLSLKSLLETGVGTPAPDETKLDAWE
jgi:uncharacterized protein YndB with AHSA1/START domain